MLANIKEIDKFPLEAYGQNFRQQIIKEILLQITQMGKLILSEILSEKVDKVVQV